MAYGDSKYEPTPDFSRECHYTIQVFSCRHRAWLKYPRVVHVPPCPFPPNHRHHCLNMAKSPRNLIMTELCSKCRPTTLGVRPKLRIYENSVEPGEPSIRKRKMDVARSSNSTSRRTSISDQTTLPGHKDKKSKQITAGQSKEMGKGAKKDGESQRPKSADMLSADNGIAMTSRGLWGSLMRVFRSSSPSVPTPVVPKDECSAKQSWEVAEEDREWEVVEQEHIEDSPK